MRTSPLVAVATLVAGSLLAASTTAVAAPADNPPPRTSASVSDPAYDTTGTDPNRRSRADVRKVGYQMPLPRNERLLSIAATIRRVGLDDSPADDPMQQVKTIVDGPGDRDFAVTFYNGPRSPRVVSLAGDRPRRISVAGAAWGVGPGRDGSLDLTITTEWLRTGDRADFTATGISRRAEDRTRTAPRLNTKYAGRYSPGADERRGGGTYADPACTTADGALSCSYGSL
ncbi:hypothetical protein [uncultured Nocardioides sp.]|uniref:hypothetical protein n=1 Tax=uncultured Nocardioides sp. TaxID=198441 RepID=UPI00262DFD9C|nr:hypothetical protein [uncultured Nocardioides sp.]